MRSPVIAILFTFAALAGACDKDSQPPPGQESGGALPEAQAMFDAKCARCHGIRGDANGTVTLHPRPHNYTDPVWQASITDDQIKEIIVRGGNNMHKSPAMPSYPPLRHRPEMLDGLVKVIRGFSKHP